MARARPQKHQLRPGTSGRPLSLSLGAGAKSGAAVVPLVQPWRWPHGEGLLPRAPSGNPRPGARVGTLTADGVGAAGTLLGVQVTEAAQAVGELLAGREALAGQRLLARGAHEALPVPRLLPVRDTPGGDGLEEARRPRSVFQGPPGEGVVLGGARSPS